MRIVPFTPDYTDDVLSLILPIQRDEFGIGITAEDQPDLGEIPSFYQTGAGNFWVALADEQLVGTIGLLDIGAAQAALRKMFVRAPYRGSARGVADALLRTLMTWAHSCALSEILLGTTAHYHAAHRFYEKNGFHQIAEADLPPSFPIMTVDTRFYRRTVPSR